MSLRNALIILLISFWTCGCIDTLDEGAFRPILAHSVRLDSPKTYGAGELELLEFLPVDSNIIKKGITLQVSHSYGTTVLSHMESQESNLIFEIPEAISNKSGHIFCSLVYGEDVIWNDVLEITPQNTQASIIESYVGPPSIIAGESDFSMAVAFPTDSLDNLLPDDTEVTYREYFQEDLLQKKIQTFGRHFWVMVPSRSQTGRIQLGFGTSSNASKQITVDVLPNAAEPFDLNIVQNHPYADGHEIVRFTTSVIKDIYGNIVGDGTLVNFWITNEFGERLHAQGSTIRGIAEASFRHPTHPVQWKVVSGIDGIAFGAQKNLEFKPSIEEIKASFNSTGNEFTVGPVYNVLQQLIPDGTEIILEIKKFNITYRGMSKKGITVFDLSKEKGLSAKDSVELSVLGFTKILELKHL